MKKFLSVVFALVLVCSLLSMVSCSKSSTTSPSPTATTGPLYSQDFETSVGTWLPDNGVTQAINTTTAAPALSTTYASKGTHSVALTIQMAAGEQAAYVDKGIGGVVNWIGKTVTMHVWIPAALLTSTYAFEITVQGGTTWATSNSWIQPNGGVYSLTPNAWNTLTYVIPAVSSVDGTSSMVGIQSIGFNIQMNGGTAMANPAVLYIDDVEVN